MEPAKKVVGSLCKLVPRAFPLARLLAMAALPTNYKSNILKKAVYPKQ